MNNINKILVLTTVVLFGLSMLSYRSSVTRAERFERGQKFLSQLNPDNIHEIEITKGEDTILLKKSNDEFLVSSAQNYPAKNEAINRFINDSINIELEKKVGSGESLEKELEIVGGEKTTRIVYRNDAGKDMVTFIVGKASEDGRGNYVKRVDGEDNDLYLTGKGVYLTSNEDSFLKKDLLDVKTDQIARISGADYVVEDKDGSLVLNGVPAGKKEGSAMSQVKNMLSGLRFDKVFLADATEVAGVAFTQGVNVDLKDGSGYRVAVANKDDKYFMRLTGIFDEAKFEESRQITREDTEEQLKDKSEALTRADEIQDFNNFHGSWVYQVTEFQAKKFLKTKAELIEDVEKDTEE